MRVREVINTEQILKVRSIVIKLGIKIEETGRPPTIQKSSVQFALRV